MFADPLYSEQDAEFWAVVKFISEELGYTDRRRGTVRIFTEDDVYKLCRDNDLKISEDDLHSVCAYSRWRAETINGFVCSNLMDARKAQEVYERLYEIHQRKRFACKLPMNKQSGAMKQVNFFTAIINIITEDVSLSNK